MEIKTVKRLDYLDSARGLAAIFVVWGHFFHQYGVQDSFAIVAHSPLRFFYNAIPAVSFFFVLSGMVLSYKYFSKNMQVNYKEYIIARLFRIYPVFLVILLLSFFIQYFLYKQLITEPPIAPGRDFWNENITLAKLAREAMLFINLQPSSSLVPPRWSLIVEMQISLLIPFMILITQKSIYWLLAFVGCVIFCFHDSFASIYFLHFGLGILIALKNKEIATRWKALNFLQKSLFFITGALLYNYRDTVPYLQNAFIPGEQFAAIINREFFIQIFEGFGSAILLTSLIGSISLQKVLNYKYLRFIGKISYSIYLCHFIILLTLTPVCIELFNRVGIDNKLLLLFIAFVITTGLVIALSALLYYLIEKPFMQYGKRVAIIITKPDKQIKII